MGATAGLSKLKEANVPVFYVPDKLALGIRSALNFHTWRERRMSERFGSAHLSGFHMTMCDGSVRNISYEINPRIHVQLGNRHDGVPLDPDRISFPGF